MQIILLEVYTVSGIWQLRRLLTNTQVFVLYQGQLQYWVSLGLYTSIYEQQESFLFRYRNLPWRPKLYWNMTFWCFRSFERTTPILFSKIVSGDADPDFLAKKKEVFNMASTSCLPSVVRMGIMLNELSLQDHVQFFKERLKGLPSRLPSIYSVYRLFAFEVNR